MIKYLLCPGWERSKNDGDRHFIKAEDLAQLYGVSIKDCVILPSFDDDSLRAEMKREELLDKVEKGELIRLHPRYDGNYNIISIQEKLSNFKG